MALWLTVNTIHYSLVVSTEGDVLVGLCTELVDFILRKILRGRGNCGKNPYWRSYEIDNVFDHWLDGRKYLQRR